MSAHLDLLTAWPRGACHPDVSDCVDKAPFIPDAKAAVAGAGHLPADSSASTRHAALGVFAAMSIAFIWVNSPAVGTYDFIHHTPFSIQLGEVGLSKPLVDWINEGLMVFFFFAVGLEIKREVLVGDLASPRRIALPAIGALGGMLAPAAIYLMFNAGNPDTEHGWAVPVATDIVLALAVLSVLGARVPASLKVFLMALAVFDDFGTLAVIALFYTEGVSLVSLTMAGFGLAVLIGLNRMRISNMTPYVLIGIFVWVAVLESGVHATIAGVLVAWTIPLTINGRPVLTVIEAGMKPWVAYGVADLRLFQLRHSSGGHHTILPARTSQPWRRARPLPWQTARCIWRGRTGCLERVRQITARRQLASLARRILSGGGWVYNQPVRGGACIR